MVRVISVPALADRILHHGLVELLDPHFSPSFSHDSFSWGTGRGPHRAVLRHMALCRRYPFRLALDVRRYFPSIHHDTLCELLYRRIREPRMRRLVRQLTRHSGTVYRHPIAVEALGLKTDPVPPGCGLAIGTHWSQWCAAVYLDGLDHFIKRELKVPGYIRYVDDLVLFASSAEQLCEAWQAVQRWLAEHRHLQLKPNLAGPVASQQPLTQRCDPV